MRADRTLYVNEARRLCERNADGARFLVQRGHTIGPKMAEHYGLYRDKDGTIKQRAKPGGQGGGQKRTPAPAPTAAQDKQEGGE